MNSRNDAVPVRVLFEEVKPFPDQVVIGKDVLELVTGAMYVDPLNIYREYIQNASDALDASENQDGSIEIEVDVGQRNVTIRDNGIGLANKDFAQRMTAIGGSVKRSIAARGFRGVGRLSGLGYCRELLFRSKSAGDREVYDIRWDGRKFREILRDPTYDHDLHEVIRDVTEISATATGEADHSFFEVELRGLTRLRDDSLLNSQTISQYLAQVAPVPFHPEFDFAAEIHDKLRQYEIHEGFSLSISEVGLTESEGEQIFRPYRNSFDLSPFKTDSISGVSFIELPGIEEGVDALAWVADHGYLGAIPRDQLVRGLRFRAGNIQVGESDVSAPWFPEPRFNSWLIGELHVLNRKIVPNGRRDNFEENAHLANLQSNISPNLKLVAQTCRRESRKRQFLRRFEGLEAEVQEDLKLLASGNVSKRQSSRLGKEADQKVLDLEERATNTSYGLQDTLVPRARVIRDQLDAVRQREVIEEDPLGVVPYAKRLAFQEVLELIYTTAKNKPVANGIVDKIVKQLASKYGAS